MTTISTRAALKEAVALDETDHPVNDLARLLIAAMTDWPTVRGDRITNFVRQFKAFHTVNRRPLDLERVRQNKFSQTRKHDLWRYEANAQIVAMMEKSLAVFGFSDLDSIVDRIVNHYEKQ